MAVAGFVVVMGLLHFQDPRSFGVKGPKEGKQYFYPVGSRSPPTASSSRPRP